MNDVMEREQQLPGDWGDNPFTAYGEEADRSGLPFLRFNQGTWVCGASNETIPVGTELLMQIDQLEIGWRKWQNQSLVDTVAGKLIEGYRPPPRSTLGDDNQDHWEPGLDNRPKDPWEFFNAAPVVFKPGQSPIDSDEVLCVGTSKGFIGAIGRVSKEYGERYRQYPTELPIVALGAGRYYNKTYRRDVDVPEFKVVGWSDLDGWFSPRLSSQEEPAPAAAPATDAPATSESRRNF